jgi:threonine/homoserine/homoserine lactone efflux protein
MDGSFAAFLAIAAVVILTPGQDTALTIRNTLIGGRAAGTGTAAGVCDRAGDLDGGDEPRDHRPAIDEIRGPEPAEDLEGRARCDLSVRRDWRQGLISSLGNPKLAVFFSSLLPQFAPASGGAFATMLALGAVFIAITFAWLCGYAFVVARAGERLRTGRIRRALDAVTGGILVAFGVRLAAQTR